MYFDSLLEIVQFPHGQFEHLGVEPPQGVLIYGPSGAGKTYLCQQVARHCQAPLTVISAGQVSSSGGLLGEAEQTLRDLFQKAAQKGGILVLDDLDQLAPNRNHQGGGSIRMVATLLTLLDGMHRRRQQQQQQGLVVIGITSRSPNQVDPAMRRPGRLDREISMELPPDKNTRLEILQSLDSSADTITLEAIADATTGYLPADLSALSKEARYQAMVLGKRPAELSDYARAMQTLPVPVMRRQQHKVAAEEGMVESWDQVGGLGETKRRLRQAVEWPLRHRQAMERLGIRPVRGVLLHGPPGCSKTTLARLVARHHPLIVVSGAVFSPYVGEAERRIRRAFQTARQNTPSVLFLDELEAMAGSRSSSSSSSSNAGKNDGVQERVLSTLLNEMDGVQQTEGVMVLGATNRVDMVDSALLRPGRFDKVLYVGAPGKAARREILEICRKETKWQADVDVEELANRTEGFSGADLRGLVREAGLLALREDMGAQAVGWDEFDRVLRTLKPSLTGKVMEFYRNIEKEWCD